MALPAVPPLVHAATPAGRVMAAVLIRASRRFLLVRFGDNWFRYESWADLFRDLNPGDRLRVQGVR